jgi:LysM repeat protein
MSMNNGPATFEYVIQPDDTLWDLADEYNTSVEDIMAANNNPNTLFIGQVIDRKSTRLNSSHIAIRSLSRMPSSA